MSKEEYFNKKLRKYLLLSFVCLAFSFLVPVLVNKASADNIIYQGSNENQGCGKAAGNFWNVGEAYLHTSGDAAGFWHPNIPDSDFFKNNKCADNYDFKGYTFPNNQGDHKPKFTEWVCKNINDGQKSDCTIYNKPYCGSFNDKIIYESEFNLAVPGELKLCGPGDLVGFGTPQSPGQSNSAYNHLLPWHEVYPGTNILSAHHWYCRNSMVDFKVYEMECDNFPNATDHLGKSCFYSANFTTRRELKNNWESIKPACQVSLKVDGKCGDRSKTYAADENNWPAGSKFCEIEEPNPTPAFPDPGKEVTWTCNGMKGGNPITTCKAKRAVPPAGVTCSVQPQKGLSPLVVKVTYTTPPGITPEINMDYKDDSTGWVRILSTSPYYYTYTSTGIKDIWMRIPGKLKQHCETVIISNPKAGSGVEVAP